MCVCALYAVALPPPPPQHTSLSRAVTTLTAPALLMVRWLDQHWGVWGKEPMQIRKSQRAVSVSAMMRTLLAAALLLAPVTALVPPAIVTYDTLNVPALQAQPVPYDPRNITNATFVFTSR